MKQLWLLYNHYHYLGYFALARKVGNLKSYIQVMANAVFHKHLLNHNTNFSRVSLVYHIVFNLFVSIFIYLFVSIATMGRQYGSEHPRDSFCFYVNLSFSSGSVTYYFLTLGNLLSFLVCLFLFCFTHLLYQDNIYGLI